MSNECTRSRCLQDDEGPLPPYPTDDGIGSEDPMDQLADYMGTLVANMAPPTSFDIPPALPPKQRAHRAASAGAPVNNGAAAGAQPVIPPRRQNKKSSVTVRLFASVNGYCVILICVFFVGRRQLTFFCVCCVACQWSSTNAKSSYGCLFFENFQRLSITYKLHCKLDPSSDKR